MAGSSVQAGSLHYSVGIPRAQIQAAVKTAEQAGKTLSDAFNKTFGKGMKGAFDEFNDAAGKVKPPKFDPKPMDDFLKSARDAASELRRLDSEQKAGIITRDEYRAAVDRQRTAMREMLTETQRGSSSYDTLATAIGRATTTLNRFDIQSVNAEVFSLRNMLEAGEIQVDDFRTRMAELITTSKQLADQFDKNSNEYRQASNAAGGAARALHALDGRVSALGMSKQLLIGSSAALRNHFGNLGPASTLASVGIAKLTSSITANNAASLTGLTVARNLAAAIGVGLVAAVAAGSAALTKMASDTSKWATELLNASDRLNMTAVALQELQHAAGQSSISADTLNMAMQRFTRRTAEAAQGSGTALATLEKLGITIHDVNGNIRSTDDLLMDVADEFAKLTDDAERTRMAFSLFDSEGTVLVSMLKNGSAGLQEMRNEAHQLGLVMSDADLINLDAFGTELQVVKDQFAMMTREIASDWLPYLRTEVVPFLQDTVVPALRDLSDHLRAIAGLFNRSGGEISEWATRVLGIAAQVGAATVATRLLAGAIRGVGAAIGFAVPQLRLLGLIVTGVTFGINALASAKAEAARRAAELEDAIRNTPQRLNALADAVDEVTAATDKRGLDAAMHGLAETLEGEAKDSFVTLAEQAIASGGDIEDVAEELLKIHARLREESLATKVQQLQDMVDVAEAHNQAAAAQRNRAQADLETIAMWREERQKALDAYAPYAALDLASQPQSVQFRASQLEQEIAEHTRRIEEAEARVGNVAENAQQAAEDLNAAQIALSFAQAEQIANQAILNDETEDGISIIRNLQATVTSATEATSDAADETEDYAGSIKALTEQISELREARDIATDPEEITRLNQQIAGLEEQRAALVALGVESDKAASKSASAMQTVNSVVAQMHESMALAAQRAAHNVSVGMDEAAAAGMRLQEELQAARRAYDALLTGEFDIAPSEELLLSIRQLVAELEAKTMQLSEGTIEYSAAWIARLEGELAIGDKDIAEVRQLLQDARRNTEERLHDLFRNNIFTGDEVDLATAQLNLLDQSLGRLPAASNRFAEAAGAAFSIVAEGATNLGETLSGVFAGSGIADFAADNLAFEEAARLAYLLGEEFDPLNEQIRINEARIRDLNSRYHELSFAERARLETLRLETAAMKEQQREVEASRAALQSLKDTISGIPERLASGISGLLESTGLTAFAKANLDMAEAERTAALLGEEFDSLGAQIEINEQIIRRMSANYDSLSVTQRIWLDRLSQETIELKEQAEAQREAADAAEQERLAAEQLAAALDVLYGRTVDVTGGVSSLAQLQGDVAASLQESLSPAKRYQQALDELLTRNPELVEHADIIDGIQESIDNLAAKEAKSELDSLVASINGIAAPEVDPLEEYKAALVEMTQSGEHSIEELNKAWLALEEAQARVAAESAFNLTGALEDLDTQLAVTATTARLFGEEHEIAGRQADLTRALIEELIPILGEEHEVVQDLISAWEELNAEREVGEESAFGVQELSGALKSVGGKTDGPLGDFMTGIGETIDLVMQFGEDPIGAVMNLVGSIISGFTAASEATRKAREQMQAQMDAMQERFDLINMDNILEQAKRTRTEVVGRILFIPITARIEYLDEDLIAAELAVAGAIQSGVSSGFDNAKDVALSGGSADEIAEQIKSGLRQAVTDAIWEGLVAAAITEGLMADKLAEIVQLIADGHIDQAMAIVAGMEEEINSIAEDFAEGMEPFVKTAEEIREELIDSITEGLRGGFENGMRAARDVVLAGGTTEEIEQAIADGLRESVMDAVLQGLIEAALAGSELEELLERIAAAIADGDYDLANQLLAEADGVIEDAAELASGIFGPFAKTAEEIHAELVEQISTGLEGGFRNGMRNARDIVLNGGTAEEVHAAVADGLKQAVMDQILEGVIAAALAGSELEELLERISEAIASGNYDLAGQLLAEADGVIDDAAALASEVFSPFAKTAEEIHAELVEQISSGLEGGFRNGARAARDVILAGGSAEEVQEAITDGLKQAVMDQILEGVIAAALAEGALAEHIEAIADAIARGDYEAAQQLMNETGEVVEEFSDSLTGIFEPFVESAEEAFARLTASIADSLQSSLQSAFESAVQNYITHGNIHELTGEFEQALYTSVSNALISAIIEQALAKTVIEEGIAGIAEAIAAGDAARAAELTNSVMQIVPELARTMEPILRIIRGFAPRSTRRQEPDRSTETQRGGGIQVAEITGPSRDILVDLLSPLRGLDGLLGVQLRQLEVQEHILASITAPHFAQGFDFGPAPVFAGTHAPASGEITITHNHHYALGEGIGESEFDSPEFRARIEEVVNEFTQRDLRRRGR